MCVLCNNDRKPSEYDLDQKQFVSTSRLNCGCETHFVDGKVSEFMPCKPEHQMTTGVGTPVVTPFHRSAA